MRLLAPLLALPLLLTACASPPQRVGHLAVRPTSAPPATTLWYVGDVKDVIAGRVPAESHRWIDADSFLLGFEAGSPEGMEGLGEFLAVNGTAYTKSTLEDSPRYYQVVHDDAFVTTGAVFLPPDSRPAARVTFGDDPSHGTITMAALYDELYHATGEQAYVVAGFVEFDTLETLAVSRAPIYGEDLFQNRSSYYRFGPQKTHRASTYLVGCAADFDAEPDPTRRDALGRVLYDNPYDTTTGLTTHAHVLVLDEPLRSSRTIHPDAVTDVNHLLSQSTVRRARLHLYPISQLAPLPEHAYLPR